MKFKRESLDWIINSKDDYTPIQGDDYYRRFKIEKNQETQEYEVKDSKLLEKAYTKAWENRDFEIDKFWTRAAYFWGFIVLIFGGYITLLTSEHNKKALGIHLDLYLILLGILFSLSWYLVIRGSKNWQRNWEAHIDMLENFVSGPIYKTVYYSGHRFYSVSKLNELMAIIIIIVWIAIFMQNIIENYTFSISKSIDWNATISILLTVVFAVILTSGYSAGKYSTKRRHFIDRWE